MPRMSRVKQSALCSTTTESAFHSLNMVSAGPQLPSPSAGKRKRDEESDAINYPSDTSISSRVPSSTSSRVPSSTPDSSAKRLRTIGPTLPSARPDERPGSGPDRNSDTSSDDDDFGPSLPGAGAPTAEPAERSVQISAETGLQASSKNQRDEWMMVPPSNSDWSARLDPTKLKARRFNTGKSATTPSPSTTSGGDNKWTETPSEKRARLEREMMGITDGSAAKPKVPPQDSVKAAATSPKLRENKVGEVNSLTH